MMAPGATANFTRFWGEDYIKLALNMPVMPIPMPNCITTIIPWHILDAAMRW